MSILVAQGWTFMRVGGSERLHLCPPYPGRLARTACNRLPLADAVVETPAALLGAVARCQACVVAGAKGGAA